MPLRVTSDTQWTALAAVNLAALIFGSTALFGKLNVSPAWIAGGRGVFAALMLLVLAALWRASLRLRRDAWAGTVITGILLALHWLTFFISVQESGVAVATLTFATFPLFTVLIEAFARRRAPGLVETGAGLTIIAAVALLVGGALPATALAREGALAGLGSALCFSLFSIASQKLGRHTEAITLSFHQNIVVAVFLLAAWPFSPRLPHGVDWAIIAGLGIFATAFMHQLYLYALKRLPASVCGGFVALEPVYAIVFAAILFGDPVTPMVVVSGVLIVGASLLLLTQSRPRVTPDLM